MEPNSIKGVNDVKKVVVAFLLGAGLAFSFSAQAEISSLVGKVVQGETEITLNGESLGVKGAIIDGVTQAPLRVLAEELELDIAFTQENGVELTSKEIQLEVSTEVTQPMQPIQNEPEVDPEKRIRWIDEEIKSHQMSIHLYQVAIDRTNLESAKDEARSKIAEIEAEIADLAAEKAALEAQLQSIEE